MQPPTQAISWTPPTPTIKELRDKFAIAAMQGDWAAQTVDGMHTFLHGCSDELLVNSAKLYYRMADAMLKVREEK